MNEVQVYKTARDFLFFITGTTKRVWKHCNNILTRNISNFTRKTESRDSWIKNDKQSKNQQQPNRSSLFFYLFIRLGQRYTS
jgi:hypothetical protein